MFYRMTLRKNHVLPAGILFVVLSVPLQAAEPNILFIFSDDHRHDLLGSENPAVSTPNLDALAESGVLFDHAFAATPICSPSRAAVLSGRYGSRNGVPTNNAPLAFPGATFAHDLAAAGYRTAQAGKWHLRTTPSDAPWREAIYIESINPSLGAEPYDALRTKDYKFIRTYAAEAEAANNEGIVYEELYDLRADPIEMNNLAEQSGYPGIKEKLVRQLETKKSAIADSPDP